MPTANTCLERCSVPACSEKTWSETAENKSKQELMGKLYGGENWWKGEEEKEDIISKESNNIRRKLGEKRRFICLFFVFSAVTFEECYRKSRWVCTQPLTLQHLNIWTVVMIFSSTFLSCDKVQWVWFVWVLGQGTRTVYPCGYHCGNSVT
jgi:hypothetical protein